MDGQNSYFKGGKRCTCRNISMKRSVVCLKEGENFVVSWREGETLEICTPLNVLNNKHTGGKLPYIPRQWRQVAC